MRQLHVDLIMDRCRVVMEQKTTYHSPVDIALLNAEIKPKQFQWLSLSLEGKQSSVRGHLICLSRTLLPALHITAISLEKAESPSEEGTFSVCNIKPRFQHLSSLAFG